MPAHFGKPRWLRLNKMKLIRQVMCSGLLMAVGWGGLSAGVAAVGQDSLQVGGYPNGLQAFWDAPRRSIGLRSKLLWAIAQAEDWQGQFVVSQSPVGHLLEPLGPIMPTEGLLKAAFTAIDCREGRDWLGSLRSLPRRNIWQGLTVLGVGLATAGVWAIIRWNQSLRQEVRHRQQVEVALRQQEEQLRLVLELTRLGTWDWDLLSDRVVWSDNHFRLIGYAPGSVEPSYQRWRQRVHPEDIERVEAAIAQAQEQNTEFYAEYRVIHPDHTVHWLLGNGHCIRDDHGKVIRIVGVILDITQSKQMEEALTRSEATLKQILQAIPDLLIWMKVDGTCVGVAGGSSVENLILPAKAIGRNQFEDLPPELAQLRRAAIATVQQTGKMHRYEQQVMLDGRIQYEEVRVVPTSEDQVLVMIRNISDRKYAELALAESERRYRMVTESMTDLVCVHEPSGRYLYLTPSVYPLLGYRQAELIGRNLLNFIHPDDRVSVQRAWEEALAGKTSSTTYRMQRQSGEYVWLETVIRHVLDSSGHPLHLQTTSRDVSDRIAVEEQLRRDALQDALTHLPNRVLLSERITQALKRIKRYPTEQFAVLFLDFDRFKVINDSLGHAVGDELLRQLAKKLCQLVRETDLVARLGGDEFVILQETLADPVEASQLAERILENLRSPILIQEHTIFITASIGIALSSPEYETAETLVRNADIAMYRAKIAGRANYVIFNPDMHFQVLSRLQVENDLRKGLEDEQFEIVYQPIVSLKTLDIVGFEALLRWQHPHMGIMLPEVFIEAAEESGLILPIGAWVLENACAKLVDWQSRLPSLNNLYLTLNLSVKQLQGATLIPQIEQVLHTTGIAPQCLTLEITESLLVKDFEVTSRLLHQLQGKGIKISIDDFGTGYSSLSYLHQLPVDSLKIDRMFVSGNVGSQKHRTIAESILALSNLLELNAVAEGIETQEQLQWLQSLSCEYGQGYLFSPPLKAQAAEDLLQATKLPWKG